MHSEALGSLRQLAVTTATFLGTFTQRNYGRKLVNFAKDRDTFAALADKLSQLMRELGLGIAVDAASFQLQLAEVHDMDMRELGTQLASINDTHRESPDRRGERQATGDGQPAATDNRDALGPHDPPD